MSVPIIVVHRGTEEYVRYCLIQAKMSNPKSDVFFLGTAENRFLCPEFVRHRQIGHYGTEANEFAKVYKHVHFSMDAYYYNLFCFQQWFVLKAFMNKHRIDQCWFINSDVMLFTDLSLNPDFRNFAFEYSWTSFVTSRGVEDLCHLMTIHFTNPELWEPILNYTRSVGDSVLSDMILCQLYVDQYLGKRVYGFIGHTFFDNNINQPIPFPPYYHEIEMLDGKKKVYSINGELFVRSVNHNMWLRANSLHFQGLGKAYMQQFVNADKLSPNGQYFDYGIGGWLPSPI